MNDFIKKGKEEVIDTGRLILRQIVDEDLSFIQYFLADKELSKYLPLDRPYNLDESLKWFQGRIEHWCKYQFGTFILFDKESNKRLGYCGIEHIRESQFIDIRYGVDIPFWGKGYAYEAANSALAYGFSSLNLNKIYGAAVPGNMASIGLLKKLGMSEDAEFSVYGEDVTHFSVAIEYYRKPHTR